MYKGEVVGDYVPDLVVQNGLIIDTKTIERITDQETRADAQLPPDHRASSWIDFELLIRAA